MARLPPTFGSAVWGEKRSIARSAIKAISANTARIPSNPDGAPVAVLENVAEPAPAATLTLNHGRNSRSMIKSSATPPKIQSSLETLAVFN